VNGAIAKSYTYDAFGRKYFESGPSLVDEFAYTARERHDRTGLYYYRNRFYYPQIGRFMTQDPIGITGGTNLYAYVGNSPVNWIDPLGLMFGEAGPILGLTLGIFEGTIDTGYVDLNIAAPVAPGIVVTGGVMYHADSGFHYYGGGGIGTGLGVALTGGMAQKPSPGLNIGIQAGVVEGTQFGYALGKCGKGDESRFVEMGLMTPGISITGYVVSDPLNPWPQGF